MTRNLAEEADRKEGGGGRVVNSGTGHAIGSEPRYTEEPSEPYEPAFGGLVEGALGGEAEGREAKPWWTEQPGDLPRPSAGERVHAPASSPPPHKAMTSEEAFAIIDQQVAERQAVAKAVVTDAVAGTHIERQHDGYVPANPNDEDAYTVYSRIAVGLIGRAKLPTKDAADMAAAIMKDTFGLDISKNPNWTEPT